MMDGSERRAIKCMYTFYPKKRRLQDLKGSRCVNTYQSDARVTVFMIEIYNH